eukprot:CAMPEP_0179450204 /NCGR_PEP_ID=MMETSP0799-20121207/34110_1 /TAXON_ID=46947 /ORGANISM="Geminigera cryophila, Strain CCMP2564" /LENGTH=70 /DNA_ID=CAMNT_0021243933 /DNA_START=38 /DNA_END=247 /DNA_ORIENTATION=+
MIACDFCWDKSRDTKYAWGNADEDELRTNSNSEAIARAHNLALRNPLTPRGVREQELRARERWGNTKISG